MKNILLTAFLVACLPVLMMAQTPVNFTCNDCAGNSHDLFSELNTGKVIVIAWVMPCGACVGPATTASTVVQGYSVSNPGQVLLYVADDYANTNCSSLNTWVSNNGITATTFSDGAVDMSAYGSAGMPKIIVLGGGATPTVFFNQNGAAAGNSANLQNAINAALVTGVNESPSPISSTSLYPNPANGESVLKISLNEATELDIQVVNELGQIVSVIFTGTMQPGENTVPVNVAELPAGFYFVQLSDAVETRMMKLEIAR